MGEQDPAGKRSQRRANMLLSGIAIFDCEYSFGEGSERVGALELALRIGPKILAENSSVGVSENPIWVIQDATKAHGPMNEVIPLGEAALQAVGRVGDDIHFAREPAQVRAMSDQMEVKIADCGAMSASRGAGQGNRKHFGISRATKYLRSDCPQWRRLK